MTDESREGSASASVTGLPMNEAVPSSPAVGIPDARPRAMWEEDDELGGVIAYMDGVDFECEVGGAMGGNRVFPSPEDVRRCKPCIDQCGIVEVRIIGMRVIQPQDFKCHDDSAQGIAARSDETQSGSAEGKSQVATPCAEKEVSNDRNS